MYSLWAAHGTIIPSDMEAKTLFFLYSRYQKDKEELEQQLEAKRKRAKVIRRPGLGNFAG